MVPVQLFVEAVHEIMNDACEDDYKWIVKETVAQPDASKNVNFGCG